MRKTFVEFTKNLPAEPMNERLWSSIGKTLSRLNPFAKKAPVEDPTIASARGKQYEFVMRKLVDAIGVPSITQQSLTADLSQNAEFRAKAWANPAYLVGVNNAIDTAMQAAQAMQFPEGLANLTKKKEEVGVVGKQLADNKNRTRPGLTPNQPTEPALKGKDLASAAVRFIWDQMKMDRDVDKDQLVNKLQAKFGINRRQAMKYVGVVNAQDDPNLANSAY